MWYGLDKTKPIISTEQERQFTEIRANLLQEIEYVLRELNILAEVSGKAMSVLQRGVSVRGSAIFRMTKSAVWRRIGTVSSQNSV